MRHDLLEEIATARDVTNAIVLTHNIDFVFLQTIVLTSLRRCGHPTLTVFADAQCAAESFTHQRLVLEGVGIRYRVVPVEMDAGFSFHPKAVLLSGPEKGILFVGSGNLTFGGWRENAEVWVRFDTAEDQRSAFSAFYAYLQDILQLVPLRESVQAEVAEALDPQSKVWAADMAPPERLIYRCGRGDSLVRRIFDVIGDGPVDKLFINAPYFDEAGAALAELLKQSRAARCTVLVQPERSTLTKRAWSAVEGSAELLKISFHHISEDGETRKAFIHSKFYGFQRGNGVIVVAGSANCSRAALTISGNSGNAELLAIHELSLTDFEKQYLGELIIEGQNADLPDEIAEGEGPSTKPPLRVLAARYEGDSLLIAYAPPGAIVTECLVDDRPSPFKQVDRGTIHVTTSVASRTVVLSAVVSGERVTSAAAWVDQERELRSTARGRSLVDTVRSRFRPGDWNVGAWADILEIFSKHLQYIPLRGSDRSPAGHPRGIQSGSETSEYTAQDVFASDYHIPSLTALTLPHIASPDGRIRSLQQLLLRWFGVPKSDAGDEPDETTDIKPDLDTAPTADIDEEVDKPEELKIRVTKDNNVTVLTERHRRRILKLLREIAGSMASDEFLSQRPPELLATDLKVAAVLFRVGLRESWIDDHEFFQLTHRVWWALFFSSKADRRMGWIEYRYYKAEDRDMFAEAMRSPELMAALIAWTFSVPRAGSLAERVRFLLASALSVARLSWLWDYGDKEKTALELTELLAHTIDKGHADATLAGAQAHWQRMIRRGHALRRLEAALQGLTPNDLYTGICQEDLKAGELLWQGAAGFAIVKTPCPRKENYKAEVLLLEREHGETKFVATGTIPLLALLTENVASVADRVGTGPRKELLELLETASE